MNRDERGDEGACAAMSAATLTEEQVLETLKTVRFPGLSRDIVSFGFVKDLAVGGGNVSFRLEITTESSRAAEQIRTEATDKLRALPGVHAVTIALDVRPPGPAAPRAAQPPAAAILPDVRFKIAVASGKGGVGKSTVAANLALALERTGRRVGLMDSDIYGPSQQMMMGIDEKPYVSEANQIVPIERYGVKVMSLGFLMDVDQPVIWRGPMVMKAVEQFLQDVAWGKLDFLVIDLPPGTGDAQLTLTQKIHLSGAVIVTTPQDVSLIDARKGLAMFQKVNVPVLGIVENMSYYVCPKCGHREEIFKHGGGERTARQLAVPFLGEIPLDPKVAIGGDSGRPIVAGEPSSPVARAYLQIAEQLVATLESN
jgi:ATP-binding protein involved in chromosome partitioning